MVQIPISLVLNTHVGGRIIYPASFSVSVPPPVNPSRSSLNAIKFQAEVS